MSASESERTFADSVVTVARLYQDAYGLDGAIEQLQARREPGKETPRVNEILAYLKRQEAQR
jgi:hypothetical protein